MVQSIEQIEVSRSPGLTVSSLTLQGFVSKQELEQHQDTFK